MSMGPSLLEERRRTGAARRTAIVLLLSIIVVVGIVWALAMLGREVVSDGPRAGVAAARPTPPVGAPAPQTAARALIDGDERDALGLQLPIRRTAITGIGYDHRDDPASIELVPDGIRVNTAWARRVVDRFLATRSPGDLRWYELSGGDTPNLMTVGADPGTDVYAPVDGEVVAIADYVVDGAVEGAIVQLQPPGGAQTIVAVRSIDADEEIAVGQTAEAGVTLIGYVRDTGEHLDRPLSDYTHDRGSGAELYVQRQHAPDTLTG